MYQQAGTVSISFLLFAFVLSLLHLAFWHSWQVACKTCRTMCQARWINNRRHKHSRRISFCTNNTDVPYIASYPNTVRVVSSRFQQAFATSSYCHVKRRKYFRVQLCSKQKDMKTHQWKSRMKHNYDKKCNSHLQCDFVKVVGNSTKADTSNIGSKFRQTFQEISNRTFFLTDPPKSLKMGSRARARRFQLQKGLATARARARTQKGGLFNRACFIFLRNLDDQFFESIGEFVCYGEYCKGIFVRLEEP